ncbi:BTB/POZ domain-containing protein 16-like isoform X2 [Littorina saxatilis]|uniref:BTB/POZ domain-containing protein 16-like isoform X2 n=1 Tax=Littorina saxatilis TaxID=31220 RepID=UPI0038B44F62
MGSFHAQINVSKWIDISAQALHVVTRKMADVSSSLPQLHSQIRVTNSYIPAFPPKVPKRTASYSRFLQEAPYSALSGVNVDGRVPERFNVLPRCRERRQVGQSNRWRLPECLYSDLLGKSQALKAINMPYNSTMVRIITAESPKSCTNMETNAPYSFRRPQTTPNVSSSREQPVTTSSSITNRDGRLSFSTAKLPTRAKSCLPTPPGPVEKYVPKSARMATPKDIFLYHSKKSMSFEGPDILLKCMGMDWELHRPFLQKAESLALQLKEVEDPSQQHYYRSPVSKTLDTYVSHSNFYSNEYKNNGKAAKAAATQAKAKGKKEDEGVKPLDHPAHISEKRVGSMSVLTLEIDDPLVTKRAMAIALGNLYHDDLDVDLNDVAGVLAAAAALGFKQLMEGCGNIMLKSINYRTVCRYYLAASKYHQEHVVLACERWLELNIIPQLSLQIQLREMSMELLQKILKSSRLFVYSEFSVFRTLAYWLFLQLNPDLQLMPTHTTVLSFFNSLPKIVSILETDEGHIYLPLFQSLRLHGITDTTNIQDMQMMNILPQAWLISLLSQHYHALQGGGDMSSVKDFHSGAVRQGFIVDDEPHYHSEVLSLHGFHFELKAVREDAATKTYVISMERLKPGDPILSFRQCERHTFSMRPDREVQYCLTVQCLDKGQHLMHTTGTITHKFGLGPKTCRSQVLTLKNLKEPIYVTYALLFPPS